MDGYTGRLWREFNGQIDDTTDAMGLDDLEGLELSTGT